MNPHRFHQRGRWYGRFYETNTGCWIWTGATNWRYGHLSVGGKTVKAHRWVYEQLVGPIPAGMELDHLCRETLCVRPDHLEPVTHRENVQRGQARGPRPPRTHGKCGHPLVPYAGGRRCPDCWNARRRERAAALKGSTGLSEPRGTVGP